MAITRDEIIKAADALERDGEKVTAEAVRAFLGGGSYTTLSPVLREWKEGRKTTVAVVLDMPGELKAVMERLGSEFWQAASKLANEKLISVQAEADSAVADAQAERDETLQEVARLESAMASLGDQVLNADQQKEAAQAAHHELQTETIRLHEKLAASHSEAARLRDDVIRVGQEKDRQVSEAARLQGLNEELNRELAEARQQLDAERQRASEQALKASSLDRELEQLSTVQERLQGSLENLQTEALTLKTSVATLEARLEDRNDKVAQLESEVAEGLALKTSIATLEARLEERNGKVAQLEAEQSALRETRQDETRQIANLTAERESGKQRVQELAQACDALRQENKTLLLMNAKFKNDGNMGK